MTNSKITKISILTLLTAAFSLRPALAADTITVQWNKLCQVAAGRELTVTTADGQVVQGFCVAIDVNQFQVRTKYNEIVSIARKSLSRIDVYRAQDHQLRSLGNGARTGLKFGWDSMLTPLGPVGLVAIPATLAWGAVAAPFCALGDLRAKIGGTKMTQQIKPI